MNLLPDLNQIKPPTDKSRLWKDECCYCFDTPESKNGLYIDLVSLLSFCKDHLQLNYSKTKHHIYLNYKKVVVPNSSASPTSKGKNKDETSEQPPKKLAIGIEGGFDPYQEEVKYEDHYSLFIFPDGKEMELDNPEVPSIVKQTCDKIKTMNSQSRKEEIVSWNAESVFPSAFAESIIQIDNPKRINPKGPWKCDVEDCDKKENLWLNLTDGFIACGRKYADGSGGNGHAQKHFEETQYPISVKLGSITKDHADVYSYPEDEMVGDPLLFQHLAHFGLNPNIMEKTEKSMAELELDQNLNFEFGKIQEKGKILENVFGPGLTGIENLGNSCYMSSVLQMLFSLDGFQNRYQSNTEQSFKEITQDPTQSFEIQMNKLADGLLSGKYSVPIETNQPKNPNEESEKATQIGIAPKMFKSLVGSNHPAFSTMQQQDALEFFQYLVEFIDRAEFSRPSWIDSANPTKNFQFHMEERIQCGSTNKVKYNRRLENVLSVPVSLDDATNKPQVAEYEEKLKANNGVRPKDEEEIRPTIPLLSCIKNSFEPYKVDDFLSPATNSKTFSLNSSKMATFPGVLVIHLKKYTYNADYTPLKLNVFMDVPDIIDINNLRGLGLKNNEELLPESSPPAAAKPKYSQEMLDQMLSMDIPLAIAKKALTATGGKDVELAMNWVFEHSGDPGINDEPLPEPISANLPNQQLVFNPIDIDNLVSMGFDSDQAKLGLKKTDGNVERAADWLFSHIDNLNDLVQKDKSSDSSAPKPSTSSSLQPVSDGEGKYQLLGFISHLGNNVQHGHYVCHILKDGRWIKFNDRHVQLSEQPPKELGYIYFYRRLYN
ncbi:hypothetical protein DICPUDRAFT_57131 [Dictyostelium purpureum]|uniref:Ubiquitin carboxyl-terminal hydrolase n=1 Tax=Dictyostelium purpureum TaxID=5786 RepID=F0ZUI0_DICPU|nr:uncharacterized protein DICPUDRAFT_57131 [Dictyostelium purpureum]EGC32386.1 hypothetical protein DICPUDRAFT_57131 [Dictyostelium purpureum]|eukprot:XP_003291072.1 hypothetical protein DICPUDRAFT_57131 [Dictyostelium purpureum]